MPQQPDSREQNKTETTNTAQYTQYDRLYDFKAAQSCVSLPPSDINDWTASLHDIENGGEKRFAGWRGQALRRARSWMAGGAGLDHVARYSLPRINLLCNIRGMAMRRIYDGNDKRSESSDCEVYETAKAICSSTTGVPDTSAAAATTTTTADLKPTDTKEQDGALESRTTKAGRRLLMSVFQIPAFMVEDYIMSSYRPLSFSYLECVCSWTYKHSELGNIVTHLAGAIIFALLALVTGPLIIPFVSRHRPSDAPKVSYADYAVIYTYLIAVLFCLTASVAFHTLSCHSASKHFRSLRCDFIGILVLIAGSFIPILYYGFLNSPKILISYMAMILGLAIAGVVGSIFGKVEDPKRQKWRPIIFMGISFSGIIPVIHGTILNGYARAVNSMSLWYVIAMGLLYVAGTTIYTFKLPERYRPGKHDVFLQSHQIFHTFVVLAALCHYIGVVRAMMWNHRVF